MKRERDSFKTPLVVEVMPSGKRFKLHYDFTYRWKYSEREKLGALPIKITVPAGFLTDFASIPRIFRIIIPKLGRWNKAAVLHDYAYQNYAIKVTAQISFIFNRKQADLCFLDAMKDLGVAKWKRYVMYWGVRAFGFFAWRKRK